jgi:hypothetical protein
MTCRLLTVLLLLVLLVGCSHQRRDITEQSESAQRFERVWVNPEIIFSDTLVTLIRADRMDSVLPDPGQASIYEPPSVEVQIIRPNCELTVNLLDANGNVVYPLMFRKLAPGYYRLSFEPQRFRLTPLLPGIYFLKATSCTQRVQTRFVFE